MAEAWGNEDVYKHLADVNKQIEEMYRDEDEHIDHDGSMQQRVFAEFSEARRARLPHEYLWWTSYEWYKGNTAVHLDLTVPGAPEVFRIRQRGRRSRTTRPINFVGHAIDLVTAKQMKTRPIFDAVPSSNDEGDEDRARITRDFLQFQWRKQKLNSKRRTMTLDRNITGNSFAVVYYDRFSAPYRPRGELCEECGGTGQKEREALFMEGAEVTPQDLSAQMPDITEDELRGMIKYIPYECGNCRGEGEIVEEDEEEPMGDVRVDFFRPWECYPHPNATSVEDAQYVFRAYKASHEQIAARFGLDMDDIKSTSVLSLGESDFARRARSASGMHAQDDGTYIIEKYMPPLPGEMQPRLTIVAGNQLVVPGPNHTEEERAVGYVKMKERTGRIPIYHFRLRPNPEHFFALGKVPEMIAANDTVNRGRSSLHKNLTRMGNPKWMVQRGTVKRDAITNEVAEVVEYDMDAPKQVSPPPLPEWIFRTIQKEEDTVYAIAGLSELDRGQVPPNVEAAQAFEVLVEQTEMSHMPVVNEDQERWAEIGHNIVQTALAYYEDDEERLVRVVGQGGRYESKQLLSGDLDDNADITVRTSSVMEVSKALKRIAITDAVNAGILPPEEAREHLEFPPRPGEYSDELRMQESVARKENDDIAKAPESEHQVTPIDDHAVHAKAHRIAALRERMKGNLEAAKALAKAALAHEEQAAAAQAPPGGGPPGGGAPGGGPPGEESVEAGVPGAIPSDNQQIPTGETPGQPQEMGGVPVS